MQGEENSEQSAQLLQWDPEVRLSAVSQNEARFSRGFFAANPKAWFPGVIEHWSPLFQALSIDVRYTGYEVLAELPDNLAHQSDFSIDGERAVLGFDESAIEAIAESIAKDMIEGAQEVVLNYIERRILASLVECWADNAPLRYNYLGRDEVGSEGIDIAAACCVHFEVQQKPCRLWWGLGIKAIERFDSVWRRNFVESRVAGGTSVEGDRIEQLSVEFVELAVAPELLIDYMRSGTVIDLEIPVSNEVQVRINGSIWARGELQRFGKNYAVSLTEFNPPPPEFPEATTRVRVEIASGELDAESLIEHSQSGAIFLTDTLIAPKASLIISNEHVASAAIGEIDGHFALTVLTK